MNREQIGKLAIQSNRIFLDEAREVLASFSADAVEKAMLSWIRLHYAEEAGNSEPSLESFLKLQETAFLTLYDRGGVIEPVAAITPLGEKALEGMRRHSGVGVEALPVPEPTLTPAQKLEAEIRADWKTLPSDKVRAKRAGNKTYREMFDRIVDTLDSQVTAFSRIEGIGG